MKVTTDGHVNVYNSNDTEVKEALFEGSYKIRSLWFGTKIKRDNDNTVVGCLCRKVTASIKK